MARARVSQRVVEVLVPFSIAAAYVPAANQSYATTTLAKIVTGLDETIIPGCDLTATGTPASVLVIWDVYFSQYEVGKTKSARLQLRRTNIAGAVLYTSATFTALVDSKAGIESHEVWTIPGNYLDAAPTDYQYVLTMDETGGTATAACEIWSASTYLLLNPTVTGIMSQDVVEVLGSFPGKTRVSQCIVEVLMTESESQSAAPADVDAGVRVYGHAT